MRGAALLTSLLLAPAVASASSLVSIEAYANLHTAGVVAIVNGDTNGNASVALEWHATTGPATGPFAPAHPLVRVDATRHVGSLFRLQSSTSYEARVTLTDPDGVSGPTTLTAAFATRPLALTYPTIGSLYVAPNGSNNNPGTQQLPLLTIQEAANRATAGYVVHIQPGLYRETVNVPHSGTFTQPILFVGEGACVILDGADAAIAAGVAWTAVGNGVHSRVTGFATGHVVTEAGRLFRYDTLGDLQALGAGAPGGFFFDGTTLYVKFADGSAPAAHTMNVARLEDGFVLDVRTYVHILRIEIRHFGAGDFGKGVYLRYASDCIVRECLIHDVESAGVWVKGGDRNRIEYNEIWDTSIFGWPWDFTKGSSAEDNGVVFTDDVGRGNVVWNNQIHGSFNGIGPCGGAAPPGGVFTNETDVYENVLYQHTDDAFEPEGWCSNVRIFDNTVRDVHMAMAMAPAAPGPLWIVRNVAWRFGNTRTSQQDGYTASAIKVNSGYATPIGPVLVYHNTFLTDAPATDAVALLNPGTGTLLRVRNNVLAGTAYALYKVNPIPWDGNGNDVYTTDPTRLVNWLGTHYNTLAAYQAGQGQELQGLSAPPQLIDPVGGNFTPAVGSALVDRGLLLPGINDGWNGAAPDVGAVESANLPRVSIADVTQAEGNTGSTDFVFGVSLSAVSTQTATVQFATVAGTATAGGDFIPTSGTVTFTSGQAFQTVPVAVVGDVLHEADETFTVVLSAPSGAVVADAQGLGTILNDDALPMLSVGDASGVDHSCSSPQDATFTVSLAGASGQTITVGFATVPGTATPAVDYLPVAGTVTFPAGVTSQPVTVPVVDDLLPEPTETFSLHLSAAVNAGIADADGLGTITDEDGGAPVGTRGELLHGSRVDGDLQTRGVAWDAYALLQMPYASYEVDLDATSGDVDPLVFQRRSCAGGVLQDSAPVGTGSARSLRWENATTSAVGSEQVFVQSGGCTSCGPDDVYSLRAYETTGTIPRFNNSATQVTVLLLQNTTGATVAGHAHFWSAAGARLLSQAFTLAPRATLVLSTSPLVPGASGSITVTHDGPYGALAGKSVALEPATGFSFDTSLAYRPR